MLHQVDCEAGGRDHYSGPGCGVFHHTVSVEVFEAVIRKHPVGFVEVVHVHADSRDTVHGQPIALGYIQAEAVWVLHADARDVQVADGLLGMAALKAQRFKYLDDSLRVLGDNLRVKGCDLHVVSPRKMIFVVLHGSGGANQRGMPAQNAHASSFFV